MRSIDADALLKEINERYEFYSSVDDHPSVYVAATLSYVADAIEDAPTIEPQKMRGKWIECDHEKWVVGVHALRCSECNGGYHLSNEMTIYYWNYCPNCGADMRGGQDDRND